MSTERAVVRALLERLLAERGLPDAILFGTQQEGFLLPGVAGGPPIEALSGFALARDGTVYRFWLAWDGRAQRHVLQPFVPLDSLGALAEDPEYLAARRQLQDHL
ncbi:MAG: hypothetical protein KatS3mg060_1666 [Dehalococcoidia bacterium]|nr:MAG: hypothetical protein KatS3mg060_1666 [Dehalococcoidia bacterium]